MPSFNSDSYKLDHLVNELCEVDRRRRYSLHIATCYFSVEAAKKLLKKVVRANITITEVHIYIDRKEAIKIGINELKSFMNRSSSYRTTVYAVRSESLFHTKGYCLLSDNDFPTHHVGKLIIGSFNLTGNGLTDVHGNIESSLSSSMSHDLREFVRFFHDQSNLMPINELLSFTEDDNLLYFKYAILLSGLFSHKWTINIDRYFRVRYYLNETGRLRAGDVIRTIGFTIDAATIGKTYMTFEEKLDKYKFKNKFLVKNFGIECSLGHWIPKGVLDDISKGSGNLKKFKSGLIDLLDRERERISYEIRRDYEELIAEGLIEVVGDPVERFWKQVRRLVESDLAMNRILHGRSYFEFPFDHVEQFGKIDDVYDELISSANGQIAKNKSSKSLLVADDARSLDPIVELSLLKAA